MDNVLNKAQKLCNDANSLFVDEKYKEALTKYNSAVEIVSTLPDNEAYNKAASEVFEKRCACQLKLENFKEAQADANKSALLFTSDSIYLKLGIAQFELGKFKSAKNSFTAFLAKNPDDVTGKRWVRKADAEIQEQKNEIEQEKKKIEEKERIEKEAEEKAQRIAEQEAEKAKKPEEAEKDKAEKMEIEKDEKVEKKEEKPARKEPLNIKFSDSKSGEEKEVTIDREMMSQPGFWENIQRASKIEEEKKKFEEQQSKLKAEDVFKYDLPAPTAAPLPISSKIKWNFYQMGDCVVVGILGLAKIPADKRNVKFESSKVMKIEMDIPEEGNWSKTFQLFAEIIPEESNCRILTSKIEVSLKKKDPSLNWKFLENPEADSKMQSDSLNTVHSYPTSKKTNFEAIEKEIQNEEKDEKVEGDQALNKLFQQIYANASQETRNAMMKSYIESGGTVLSTNWEEVGKAKVEGDAPKGMEMIDSRTGEIIKSKKKDKDDDYKDRAKSYLRK